MTENKQEPTPPRRSTRNKSIATKKSTLVTVLALMANSANIFENVAARDSLVPLITLPKPSVDLEQDFGSTFLKEPEMKKPRELKIMDQLSATYGSELVAARLAVELAIECRYSLQMLSIEVDSPCMLFGDNNSVIINMTIPSSMLKKKHNAIAYHRFRECLASEVVRFVHVDSISNLADCLTKPLGAVSFWRIVRPILFRSTIWKDASETEKGKQLISMETKNG